MSLILWKITKKLSKFVELDKKQLLLKLTFREGPDYTSGFCNIFCFRSSPPELFFKKGLLRNFAKFRGKLLCQVVFFNKVAGLSPATLLKKRLWHRCFPVNFAKFLRSPFLIKHYRCENKWDFSFCIENKSK